MRDWKEGAWEAQREEREGEKGCNYILTLKLYLKVNKSKCHRKKLEINYKRKITENLTSVDGLSTTN